MTTVGEIYRALDEWAPFARQESWDNSGLLVGGMELAVDRAILLLDAAPDDVRRAAAAGAQLLITHHPVIFKPLKRVETGSVAAVALQNGLSILCAHTNLDVAEGGVNDCLAAALGLEQVGPFSILQRECAFTLAVIVPAGYLERLYNALTQAGAGQLGRYAGCAFASMGEGRFRPLDGAHPFLGQVGVEERGEEVRLQMLVRREVLPQVLAALHQVHPYEQPAYDLFENHGAETAVSLGRTGVLPEALEPLRFASLVNERLGRHGVRWCAGDRPVRRVAVCGGAGGSLLREALAQGVDALVTSEVKQDQWVDARQAGLTVVDGGHYPTEAVALRPLRDRLATRFPDVAFTVDEQGGDVFRTLTTKEELE